MIVNSGKVQRHIKSLWLFQNQPVAVMTVCALSAASAYREWRGRPVEQGGDVVKPVFYVADVPDE